MGNLALRIEGIGKQYRIGKKQQQYRTLRETIVEAVQAPFHRMRKRKGAPGPRHEPVIWALKDVSLDIKHGEVVGIIGHNGAGKSTLLKILSRVTEPTTGSVDLYGRVGSLLEVGTGFHSELTGRENIYLNGAILGMRRAEIERKFDEIVAFAEVEDFIDTPVKHYSSGMYLRLAFAVAAHLEPEILIVDEVLAVGDVNFQRKCLDKMQNVGQQGRTVLLVSHNMSAITRLCERAVLLHRGHIIQDGPAHRVVNAYLNSGLATTAAREWPDPTTAPGDKVARLRAVRVRTADDRISDIVDIRHPVRVEMEYDVFQAGWILLPYFQFRAGEGLIIFESNDLDPAWCNRPRPAGRWVSTAEIPGNLLAEGLLTVSAGLLTLDPARQVFCEHDVVGFQVIDLMEGGSARGNWNGTFEGVVRPLLRWETQYPVEQPVQVARA